VRPLSCPQRPPFPSPQIGISMLLRTALSSIRAKTFLCCVHSPLVLWVLKFGPLLDDLPACVVTPRQKPTGVRNSPEHFKRRSQTPVSLPFPPFLT